jgi:uncharacterized protein YbbC (DUF1343 family)
MRAKIGLLATSIVLLTASIIIGGGVVQADGPRVKCGLDVLAEKDFAPLMGKKVGLLVNQTARTHDGKAIFDLLRARDDVKLVTIFTPEHGLDGKKDEKIASSSYEGIPVVSLYGERLKPKVEELKGLDALVYDIQDVGVRYYTYLATLGMALEVARDAKVKVIVLDRPDPAGGDVIEGPIADEALGRKFTSWSAIPTRYALTIGEYARWVNEVEKVGCDLEVVRCEGWKRGELFPETGLPWRDPSPNLRSAEAALLYTGTGFLEQTNLSVGRGTDAPFLVYGAPFVDGVAWAKALEERKVEGVKVEACEFTPTASAHAKKPCRGVRLNVTDARKLRTVTLGLHMLDTLRALSKELDWKNCGGMLGERAAPGMLGTSSVEELLEGFAKGRAEFEKQRRDVLLYD